MFENIIAIDEAVSAYFKSWTHLFFSAVGATVYLAVGLVIVTALYFLVKHKRNKKLELISIGIAVLYVLIELIKRLVGRVRPDGSDAFSFPSRHAAIAFFIALTLPVKPLYRALLIIWAVVVSLSRIIIQEHYLSDVLFSIGLGILAVFMLNSYQNKKLIEK